jgi:hypothetical protein
MDINFLGHAKRLWTVPLLYNALPSDRARVFAQIVFGIACWSALAFAVARSFRSRVVQRLGAVLVLLLGLCVQVTSWDQAILSESIALSLTALLVAALLWLRLRPTRWVLVGTLVVVVLWVFTRQLQAAVYVPVGLCVITWILLRARRYLLVACALALISAWAGYAATQADSIKAWNAHTLLTMRILKTPDGADFFASHGMPDVSLLEKEVVHPFPGHLVDSPVHRDPKWQAWIAHHWNRTYTEWLLRHPIDTIRDPLADAPKLLSGAAAIGSPRPVIPSPVQDSLWERSSGDIPLWIALVSLVWLAALRAGRPGGLDALSAGIIGTAMLLYFGAWHLSATELGRLMLEAAALLRIGLFVLLLSALDRITLSRVEAPRQ